MQTTWNSTPLLIDWACELVLKYNNRVMRNFITISSYMYTYMAQVQCIFQRLTKSHDTEIVTGNALSNNDSTHP